MKKIAKKTAFLLGLAVCIALTVTFFSPVGIALVGRWDTSKGVVTANAKNDVVMDQLEIDDVRIARKIYDSKTALFVDARSHESYEDGHYDPLCGADHRPCPYSRYLSQVGGVDHQWHAAGLYCRFIHQFGPGP